MCYFLTAILMGTLECYEGELYDPEAKATNWEKRSYPEGSNAENVSGLGAAACSAHGSSVRALDGACGAFPLPGARGPGLLWLEVKKLGKHVAGFLVQME
ncbi:unnamed protein product [Caretta caretta]